MELQISVTTSYLADPPCLAQQIAVYPGTSQCQEQNNFCICTLCFYELHIERSDDKLHVHWRSDSTHFASERVRCNSTPGKRCAAERGTAAALGGTAPPCGASMNCNASSSERRSSVPSRWKRIFA